MARDWESWLKNATGPASNTEEADRDRTEKRIRDAIERDTRLSGNVRVYAKGSYAAGTNVRRDSDVDIAVEWTKWAYCEQHFAAKDLTPKQAGWTPIEGNPGPTPSELRSWVEDALANGVGGGSVQPGNKAILVLAGGSSLDADVVPCFALRRYDKPNVPLDGIRLYPKDGSSHITNWPVQNKANGIRKNTNTARCFKGTVRAIKRLENDLLEVGRIPALVPGFFIESLIYNVGDTTFTKDATWKGTVLSVLAEIWNSINDGRHKEWAEVNDLKYLFGEHQRWNAQEALDFTHAGWNYVNGN